VQLDFRMPLMQVGIIRFTHDILSSNKTVGDRGEYTSRKTNTLIVGANMQVLKR
jgi:hypothetical protein